MLLVGDVGTWPGNREDLESAGLDVEVAVSAAATPEGGRTPDVVVVSDESSLQRLATRWSRGARGMPAVVVVTRDEGVAAELVAIGTPGWAIVPPDATGAELAAAVLAAGRGFAVRPTAAVGGESGEAPPGLIEALTPREREVLNFVAEGLPNRAIAARLGISEHTVKFHLASIFGKLGASTRTEAVRAGVRAGLVTL